MVYYSYLSLLTFWFLTTIIDQPFPSSCLFSQLTCKSTFLNCIFESGHAVVFPCVGYFIYRVVSSFIHDVTNDKISLFNGQIPFHVYMYHILFIHCSADKHVSYFYSLAIKNSATNTGSIDTCLVCWFCFFWIGIQY